MQFYCGETHDGHDAGQDTIASIKVFQEQAKHYQLDLTDLRKLADETNEATFLDISRKIRIGDDGRAVYAFGKHRDEPVIENEKYARWMIEKGTFSTDTKRVVLDILLGTIR
jgi:cytidylate kinase